MFTGIVQTLAKIIQCQLNRDILRYGIEFSAHLLDGLQLGASISVDGVCQTVVEISGSTVYFEAIEETLQKTTLKDLSLNQKVNIERSLKFGDEVGGHLLSGHVYTTVTLKGIQDNIYTFHIPHRGAKYLFEKGFIALDGISLTLVQVTSTVFTVHLIPETLERTTFGFKKPNDHFNIELDATTQAAVDTVERLLSEKS